MFDYFLKEKSDFLSKKDKSKKGHIDKDIAKILDEINSKKDYYTTSSCAGRIVLLEMKSKKKNECNWIFTKHDKVNLKDILKSLRQYDKNIPKYYNIKNKKTRERPLNASALKETRFKSKFESTAKYPIWFKQQPLILHIACRNLESAKKLLAVSRKIFRRAGIIGITERKVMVEIIGDERLETIIADKNFAADEKYLKQLVKYANRNFEENKKRGERFLELVKNI